MPAHDGWDCRVGLRILSHGNVVQTSVYLTDIFNGVHKALGSEIFLEQDCWEASQAWASAAYGLRLHLVLHMDIKRLSLK